MQTEVDYENIQEELFLGFRKKDNKSDEHVVCYYMDEDKECGFVRQ